MRQLVRRMLFLASLLTVVGSCLAATDSAAAPAPSKTAQTLVRSFDLTVSLEWTPGTTDKLSTDLVASGCPAGTGADSYVDDVIDGLRATSEYLYDISDGQMALRNVTIYPGAQNWATADIRILASNSTRPAAFPGGIVDVPTRYNGGAIASTFYPGTIYLGRSWDGGGSRCGRWSAEAGSRTIGHEWGHYALYLWDEYVDQTTSQERYCTNVGADPRGTGILNVNPAAGIAVYSMMAYQYTADELWHPNVPHTGSCRRTPQWTVHGAADWDSIRRFYPLTLPAQFGVETPFEGSDAEDMFNPVVVQPPAGAPADTSAPATVNPLASARLVGQAYMVRPVLGGNGQPVADRRPLKIIGQGEIAAEGGFTLPFWGATPSAFDRAAVIVQDWSTNATRASFPANYRTVAPLNSVAPNNVTPTANLWQPTVSISPTLTSTVVAGQRRSEVTGITVRVSECIGANPPQMQFVLCPAGGNCGAPVNASWVSGAWQWTFTFPYDGTIDPPASYGYVYARVPGTAKETMSWYQLAGAVGPATIEAHAPLLDGSLNVDIQPGSTPPQNRDSMVMFSPAQTCRVQLPAGIRGILSTPLNVQVAVGNRPVPWGGVAGDPNLRVRMSYNQELASRMGINEDNLVLLRYVTLSGIDTWQVVPLAGRSLALDWITARPRPFNREGEIFAVGYR